MDNPNKLYPIYFDIGTDLKHMFRQGKARAFIHNLRLATMLSFVAGIVNISGVLAIGTLTTNVTGHFAYFSEELVRAEYQMALTYISYILFFLSGAFLCGFLVEMIIKRRPEQSHALPIMIEISVLVALALATTRSTIPVPWIASTLLFAMGLQNALVTQISKATVRTTHLTGLFTDLGIELSQLLFYRDKPMSAQLLRSIYLRLAIISFFFLGGVLGGFLFQQIALNTLLIASAVLLSALLYNNMLIRLNYYRRKLKA